MKKDKDEWLTEIGMEFHKPEMHCPIYEKATIYNEEKEVCQETATKSINLDLKRRIKSVLLTIARGLEKLLSGM